jgi:lactoylglutathione lyase
MSILTGAIDPSVDFVGNMGDKPHVDDIYGTCKKIATKGGKVTRAPGAMKHGNTIIAFVEDPSGYKVELIQIGDR